MSQTEQAVIFKIDLICNINTKYQRIYTQNIQFDMHLNIIRLTK